MKKMVKVILGIIIIFIISIIIFLGVALSRNPFWVYQLIVKKMTQTVTNPASSIAKYTYNGQTVYYISSGCCDKFDDVYNLQGQYLCAPSGGFTGRGDGKCTDFDKKSSNYELIWKDTRN